MENVLDLVVVGVDVVVAVVVVVVVVPRRGGGSTGNIPKKTIF